MEQVSDSLELSDIVDVLWKKKWFIILPTIVLMIITGIIGMLLPKIWEIQSIISPGKFMIQTENGDFREVIITSPDQIARQINENSYNARIAEELNIDPRNFPKFRAENLNETNLVRISTREKDVDKAKSIQESLFAHIKEEMDNKVDIELKGLDSQITSLELQKSRTADEIAALQNKLKIITQRKTEIEKEMALTKDRIKLIEEQQRTSLKKEGRIEAESIALLLYSNEIQQSLKYHNELSEMLSQKKLEQEDTRIEMKRDEEIIRQLENSIENMRMHKGRIDHTQLIKIPTVSIYPVSPRKLMMVAVSGFVGVLLFAMLALFINYLKEQKRRS